MQKSSHSAIAGAMCSFSLIISTGTEAKESLKDRNEKAFLFVFKNPDFTSTKLLKGAAIRREQGVKNHIPSNSQVRVLAFWAHLHVCCFPLPLSLNTMRISCILSLLDPRLIHHRYTWVKKFQEANYPR